MVVVFWAMALALFAVATRVGRHFGLIPIVSQLLLATIGLPLLMYFWIEPQWQLSGAALVSPGWLKNLYSLSFALLLGYILSDVIDLQLDRQSLKIALPSFCIPFACGLVTAVWLLPPQPWISSLAVGLLFAITAIPVLYLYLRHIDYPPAATRRLVQTAILIDLACWTLFGIAQGSLHLSSLLLPLAGACLPVFLRLLGLRQLWLYSLGFFALLVVAEHYKLNALIFGIGYVLIMAALKAPLVLPLPAIWMNRLQTYCAIPLILTFGIVQINVHSAMESLGWLQLAALLLLPIVSKLLGNWIGLGWAGASFQGASRWRESVLLNIRGLSEIVFLNLLLQQQLISPALYFALMLMGLIATLLPALAGMHRIPLNAAAPARSPMPTVELQRHPIVVIGAGPSGAIAAALLKRKGHDVLVIERQHFPRFSIGESLLSHCLDFVEEAGMLDAVNAAGFQLKTGAAFAWGERYSTFDFGDTFTQGKPTTFQVQRADFDKLLADQAALQGVEIRYGETIVSVDIDRAKPLLGVQREDGSEYRIEAGFMLDASGYGRVLPRLLDLEAPSNFPVRQAVFTHVEDHIDNPNFDRTKILVTTHPTQRDIWFWTIPFSNGRCSVGVVAAAEHFEGRTDNLDDCLRGFIAETPSLSGVLNNAVWDTPARTIGGYSANVKTLHGPGFALLGNAAEFLDPVFSSGVTIAMRSASMAAAVLHRQLQGETVDWQGEFAEPLKRGVDTFRCYVEGWYAGTFQDVIYFPRGAPDIRRMISSILAGYAWDERNPFVAEPKRRLRMLSELCARDAT